MPTPSTTHPTDATLELLERLVAIDSTSAVSNLPVIDACEQVLTAAGVWTERVPAPPHGWAGGDVPKAGLLARVGPDVDGGVVLSGHTDCVPVTDQPWTTDPFTLTQRGDRLVGRGTTDMKGFIAAAVHAATTGAEAALARPLWLLLTWDEEIGTVGADPMTDALMARTRPAAAIVGEPTSMRPATSHKGVRSYRVTVEGREGHSSRPDLFANALTGAARIATYVADVAERLRDGDADDRFTPPYTTLTATQLRSGTAVNIIPRLAELLFEYRPVPADDSWDLGDEVRDWTAEHVLPRLRAVTPEADVRWQQGPLVRALEPEQGGAAEALVRRCTGDDAPALAVPFGTDGGWHQAAGISTVVCGPGDIEQAHQPDEWIALPQLAACEAMLTQLLHELADG